MHKLHSVVIGDKSNGFKNSFLVASDFIVMHFSRPDKVRFFKEMDESVTPRLYSV